MARTRKINKPKPAKKMITHTKPRREVLDASFSQWVSESLKFNYVSVPAKKSRKNKTKLDHIKEESDVGGHTQGASISVEKVPVQGMFSNPHHSSVKDKIKIKKPISNEDDDMILEEDYNVPAEDQEFTPVMSRKKLKRLQPNFNKKSSKHTKRNGDGNGNLKVSQGPTMMTANSGSQGTPGSLRPIVIDGSNVAMRHGGGFWFSVKGIQIVINYFKSRGHTKIVAFVPQIRSEYGQSSDAKLLESLRSEGLVVFTPSNEVDQVSNYSGKTNKITRNSYDDTFILDYAAAHGGVVVTRDNFRDLANKKPEWNEVIENRILMQTFVGDDLIFPHDPLGQYGPDLDTFLKF